MANELKISKEVVRLAQFRTRTTGGALNDELARSVVSEAIYNSDPEAGLVIEEDAAYSNEDALAALGVNDMVVNGCRVDVRTLDEGGSVSLQRSLIGNHYMTAGTLAVALDADARGAVVGFVPAAAWLSADATAGSAQTVSIAVSANASFDIAALFNSLSAAPAAESKAGTPTTSQIRDFVGGAAMPIEQQQRIAAGILANPDCWSQVSEFARSASKSSVRSVLRDGATWNARVERIADAAGSKFKRLSREEIKKTILRIGETLGGQPEAPAFRKELINGLMKEELSKSLAGQALKKASSVADAVLSGRAVNDAVKEVTKSPVVVQMAEQIKRSREKVVAFVDVTAQELAASMQQLAMQPAYATHTSDPAAGLEAINDTVKMLDAAELAESMKELDNELSGI